MPPGSSEATRLIREWRRKSASASRPDAAISIVTPMIRAQGRTTSGADHMSTQAARQRPPFAGRDRQPQTIADPGLAPSRPRLTGDGSLHPSSRANWRSGDRSRQVLTRCRATTCSLRQRSGRHIPTRRADRSTRTSERAGMSRSSADQYGSRTASPPSLGSRTSNCGPGLRP